MKNSLAIIFRKLQALRAFEGLYQTEGHTVCTHALDDSGKLPLVTLYPEHDRQWILDTFGAEGWETDYADEGFQHVRKDVDGVTVAPFRAYQIDAEKCDPKAVAPELLTGREACIELAPSAVRAA